MEWSALERISGLIALPTLWKKRAGNDFEAFRILCLEPATFPALSYPCPLESSCAYRIRRNPGAVAVSVPTHSLTDPLSHPLAPFTGTCETNPPRCPLIDLSLADITPLQLNWPKLGRAICRALSLDSKATPLPVPTTLQIGSWSTDAVPVLLTIQAERHHLHFVICELIAILRQKFIVLTPTSKHYDAKTQQFLAGANSAIFPLDSIVALNPDGTLSPARPPADLFANFGQSPQSKIEIQKSKMAKPRFALRKGLGFWTLIFDGYEIVLKHERGIFYIAWLLYHPDQTPIHALDLMAKIPEIYRHQLGLTEITDPETGKTTVLESHARLQERSLSLDDAQAMRALFRKEKELEAILDDPDESEPVKAEALRDLEAIAEFQRKYHRRSRTNAQRAAHSVRAAIARFHEHLAEAARANHDPALASFADHINKHILIPSRRFTGQGNRYARSGLAGCVTYEPPPNFNWHS